MNSRDAIYQACLLRFRPIMMTTMCALLGGMPMAPPNGGRGGSYRQRRNEHSAPGMTCCGRRRSRPRGMRARCGPLSRPWVRDWARERRYLDTELVSSVSGSPP